MSILIKGIDMPKAEFGSMIVAIRPDGMVEDVMGCYVGKAVPVPPHGRLIDADALMNDGWTLHKQVMRMGGYAIHEMPLDNPNVAIVIPADKDGESR